MTVLRAGALFVLISLLAAGALAADAPANLIRNGGFEEGLKGWACWHKEALAEGGGNDFDIASALAHLLKGETIKDPNIPSRYVYGSVRIPIAAVMNWLGGVDTPEIALAVYGKKRHTGPGAPRRGTLQPHPHGAPVAGGMH